MTRPSTRLVTAAILAVGLLLTACSGGTGGGAEPTGPTRVVTDMAGAQVTVPVQPQRVVTLHYAATLPALDLGVVPVGHDEVRANQVPERLASTLAPVPVVTARFEPQLEQVGLLEPDLILAPDVYEEDVLGQLREIAPVYTVTLGDRSDAARPVWQDRQERVADVLGRAGEGTRLVAEYEARRDRIAQTYAPRIRATPVAAISAFRDNDAAVWGARSSIGRTLTSLGFPYSAQADAAAAGRPRELAMLSFERIGGAVGDAGALFVDSDLRGQPNTFVAALAQTPLYQGLPAVSSGRAFPIGKTLVAGWSDAMYNLDQVERALQG